jgi:hypothetical protein
MAVCGALASGRRGRAPARCGRRRPDPIATPEGSGVSGRNRLAVDASDPERRIVHVRENLSGVDPDTVLLYPKWLPGNHAPQGPIDRLAGLKITANGAGVRWARDPVDVYAFRLQLAPGFDRSTSNSITSRRRAPGSVRWRSAARSRYSTGTTSCSIRPATTRAAFRSTRASRFPRMEMGLGARGSVRKLCATRHSSASISRRSSTVRSMPDAIPRASIWTPAARHPCISTCLQTDRADLLAVSDQQLEVHRALVQQAYKLFRSRHFAHYDFLYSLSDQVQQRDSSTFESSENGSDPGAFTNGTRRRIPQEPAAARIQPRRGTASSAGPRTCGRRISTCRCRTVCCGFMKGSRNIGVRCWRRGQDSGPSSRRSINSR